MYQGIPRVKERNVSIVECREEKKFVTEKRREAEYEACREEVLGPREVLDSDDDDDDDGDSNVERATRESIMRSNNEEEERRRMMYESASKGGQYEEGGGSCSGGGGCCVGCLVKSRLADDQIFWSQMNLPHNRLVD